MISLNAKQHVGAAEMLDPLLLQLTKCGSNEGMVGGRCGVSLDARQHAGTGLCFYDLVANT